jgi:predicted nuclease with RNAse H fold
MRTLGIDLASDPLKTGVCMVDWRKGQAVIEKLRVGADDRQLLAAYESVDVTGIDAPFGWPVPFVEMLCDNSGTLAKPWNTETKNELRFRSTDVRVLELTGKSPLSVSTDLIGVPALRCAGLLTRMGVTDRSGDGRVYETYPSAALNVWRLPSKGYKGPKKRQAREALWAALKQKTPWLRLSDEGQESLIVDRDDALDALVAALIARAAKMELTIPPTNEEKLRARTEGWIHVPIERSLQVLA